MNRHLIWIIGSASVLGLGVPALAAARSAGTPEDNGVPGEVRGNCDEAEHASDPNCLVTVGAGSPTVTVTVPSTVPITLTVPTTVAGNDDVGAVSQTPSVPTTSMADVSGRCDEAEHATDPRCTGLGGATDSDDDDDGVEDDHSGQSGSHDDDDDDDDDHSGRGHGDDVDDDHSGSGGGDDRSDDSGHDDGDDDDRSGHGGGDD